MEEDTHARAPHARARAPHARSHTPRTRSRTHARALESVLIRPVADMEDVPTILCAAPFLHASISMLQARTRACYPPPVTTRRRAAPSGAELHDRSLRSLQRARYSERCMSNQWLRYRCA